LVQRFPFDFPESGFSGRVKNGLNGLAFLGLNPVVEVNKRNPKRFAQAAASVAFATAHEAGKENAEVQFNGSLLWLSGSSVIKLRVNKGTYHEECSAYAYDFGRKNQEFIGHSQFGFCIPQGKKIFPSSQ